jgi:antitoxin ParD1/3/4
MTTIHLNLSDAQQQFLQGEMQAGHFTDPAAYIESLIERARKGKQRLESMLIEGLNSGDAIPLDEAEWNRIRGEVHRRLANG